VLESGDGQQAARSIIVTAAAIEHEVARVPADLCAGVPGKILEHTNRSAVGDGEKLLRAFRSCVVRVDNVRTANLSADVWEPARATDESHRLHRISEILTDEEVNEFDLTTIYELGGVAHGLCFFPRGIAPRFVLPDLSVQTWDAMRAFRLAEQAATSAAIGKSESDAHAG